MRFFQQLTARLPLLVTAVIVVAAASIFLLPATGTHTALVRYLEVP